MVSTRLDSLVLQLYLVTDARLCGELGVVETVRRAVAGGVTTVQLRDSELSDDDFVAVGRELIGVLADTGVPLIVNDRVHLVEAIGADGAHVGQDDLDIEAARALLGPDRILGLSAASAKELHRAEQAPPGTLDYIGAGVFRATATKPDHPPVGGLDLVRFVHATSHWPFVVIGGIGLDDVGAIRRAGAGGVAVVSAICGQPDVTAAARALRTVWEEAR